ncbi:MAG: hypothetical protein CL575_12975 [Altererythrobacter sp.]|nr:hypothetical protein [Erythrobacter sp.]MAW91112.1 hypothetical protein [Altererythrobacter sp.]MBK63821.1 hypothetical protein [Altererythrobacter sp.]|tara:strand:- start:258 stop:530 length:273 start_codon:yes stop_codon:yes gene_type:complete
MVRQFLAFLALLTGLAALGTPAQAAMDSAVGSIMEQASSQDSDKDDSQVTCAQKQLRQKLRGEKVAPCKKQETVTVYIPTVMFGADRAFE